MWTVHYVYILLCNDGCSYTGCTKDLKERFQRHLNGYVPATKPRLPVELVFSCAFKDKYKAFEFEKYLKSGSGRAFMQKRFFPDEYSIHLLPIATTSHDVSRPAVPAS